MLLINRTPLNAVILPNADSSDGIVALFVVAATFDIGKDRLRFSEEQLPLRLAPEGVLIGDGYHTKAGTSVNATGFVYAAGGSAVRADASLFVGEEQRTVAAIGPRTWREIAGGGIVASAPQRFDRIAMAWENAYGGAVVQPTRLVKLGGEDAIFPEHPEAYGENMDGKGFYTDARGAIDAPLPELEDPERLIKKWDDRPDPVCFAPYPMHGALRARFVVDDKNVVDFSRHQHVLSRAAPFTTFGEIAFGTRVAVVGMRPGGEILSFDVPPPPVTVDVKVGERHRRLTLYVDAIDIDAEASQVRIAYRALFSYPLVRYEERTAYVLPSSDFEKLLPSSESEKATLADG